MHMSSKLLKISTIIFLLSLSAISSVAAQTPKSVEQRIYKIGVSTALTGSAATYGQDIRDALLFANEKLGNGRFKLIIEDDRCHPKDAVTVAHKFIDVDKVDFVLGFACSGAALGALPLYERAKIPVIVIGASSPKVAEAGEYIFRTTPSDLYAADALYGLIKKKQKSVALLSELTDYAQDLKNAFVARNQSNELTIITKDYLPDSADFKTLLLSIKSKNPEAIFINTQAESTFATILKQLHELGWKIPVYGAYWPGSPALLSVAKEYLEGVQFADTPSLKGILNSEGQALFKEFVAQYGSPRSYESVFASAYAAFSALSQTVSEGHGDDVKSYLSNTKFNGIFGPFSFDQQGEIVGMEFSLKKIENGEVVLMNEK